MSGRFGCFCADPGMHLVPVISCEGADASLSAICLQGAKMLLAGQECAAAMCTKSNLIFSLSWWKGKRRIYASFTALQSAGKSLYSKLPLAPCCSRCSPTSSLPTGAQAALRQPEDAHPQACISCFHFFTSNPAAAANGTGLGVWVGVGFVHTQALQWKRLSSFSPSTTGSGEGSFYCSTLETCLRVPGGTASPCGLQRA